MINGIKISIVTVCFNCVELVEKTVKSVLEQDYENVEYIVIDGASSDGTCEVIEKYRDRITYYLSEKDAGIYDAMNKGIKAATGELIGFIGAGDWYEEGAIKAIADTYMLKPADVIYGDVTVVDGTLYKRQDYSNVSLRDMYYYMLIIHPGLFVRTSLQKENPFDTTYRIAADYKFLMGLYHRGCTFMYANHGIVYYPLGGVSSTKLSDTIRESRRASYEVLGKDVTEYESGIEKNYLRHMLMCDPAHLESDSENMNLALDYLGKWLGAREVYLWGTGMNAWKCKWILDKAGIKIKAFIDSDSTKWGCMYEGIEVIRPKKRVSASNPLIIVTSTKYEEEIKAEISSLYIEESVEVACFAEFFGNIAENVISRKQLGVFR